MLGLVLRGLSLCRVLHRMLVHAGVSRQQTHVVLLAVVADGSPVTEGLLQGLTRGGQLMLTSIRTLFFLTSIHTLHFIYVCHKRKKERDALRGEFCLILITDITAVVGRHDL